MIVGVIAMNGSTDYIEGYVYQNSGSNQTVNGLGAFTFMSGAWIGP